MERTLVRGRALPILASVAALHGCFQVDQKLPLDLDESEGVTRTVGADGGIVSVPPAFSMTFPSGSVTGSASVSVRRRITAPFPADAGPVLPGTAFDLGPAGTVLAKPATVQIRVPGTLLDAGDELRLAVALLRADGSLSTSAGSYDVTAGILSAPVGEIGPVAAVIGDDAIDVELGLPPTLGGGSFGGVAGPGSGSGSDGSNQTYGANCSPSARRCFSSGLVRFWISDALRQRLGNSLVIQNAALEADLTFTSFDAAGQPTAVTGVVKVTGNLKARVGAAVSNFDIDERRVTGGGTSPTPTAVTISGNTMVLARTSEGLNTALEFGLSRVGTGHLMTVGFVQKVTLTNDNGSKQEEEVRLQVRLRR